MSGIKEEMRKEKESDIKYCEDLLVETKTRYTQLDLLIDNLEVINAPKPWYVGRSGLRFRFNNSNEAREFAHKVMTHFPVEKVGQFEKNFSTSDGSWYWEAILCKDMSIQISPATPSEDCEPVQEVKTYKSWVCRSKNEQQTSPTPIV